VKKLGTIDWALLAKKINEEMLATPSARVVPAFGLITHESLYVVVKKYTAKIAMA